MPYLSTIFKNNRRYLTGIPQLLLYDAGWRAGQLLVWRVYRDGRAVVRPLTPKKKGGTRARTRTHGR